MFGSPPLVGYHVSAARNREKILRNGIVPSYRWAPYVYFWKTLRNALWFVEHESSPLYGGSPMMIWKINIRGLRMEQDPETEDMRIWTHSFEDDTKFEYKNPVPPNGSGMMTKDRVGPERIISAGVASAKWFL